MFKTAYHLAKTIGIKYAEKQPLTAAKSLINAPDKVVGGVVDVKPPPLPKLPKPPSGAV